MFYKVYNYSSNHNIYNIIKNQKDITEKVRLVVLHGLATIDAFIGGNPSESALQEAFIRGMPSKSSLRESVIGGMPYESAVRSKSKKINEATGSNQSRTLFWKK
jgi:hypothetical protein